MLDLIVVLCLCVFCVIGCGKKKPQLPNYDNIKTIQATPLPELAPKPNTEPVVKDINQARGEVVEAIVKVETLRTQATAKIPEAVHPIEQIKDHMSTTVLILDNANAHVEEWKQAQKLSEEVYKKREETLTKDFLRNKETCIAAATDYEKRIQELIEKNKKLEDEGLQKMRFWFRVASGVIYGFAALSIVAFFFLKFSSGLWVASVLFALASIVMTLASWLATIEIWTSWIMGACLIIGLCYGAWKLFTHDSSNCPILKKKQ